MTSDERVPQIALVSQSNAENRRRNIIFIKPHNFDIIFRLHGDRTVILVWGNSKNILLTAIFPYARLLAWTRPEDTRTGCTSSQITFCTFIGRFKPPVTRVLTWQQTVYRPLEHITKFYKTNKKPLKKKKKPKQHYNTKLTNYIHKHEKKFT